MTELANIRVSDPSLSANLLELYYGGGDTPSQFDIHMVTRASIGSSWSTPVIVQTINTTSRETAPELVGNELFFSTTRATGSLTRDIFRSIRLSPSDPWMAPLRVDELSVDDESDVGIQGNGLRAIVGWRNTQPDQADLVEWTRDSLTLPWQRSRTLSEVCSAADDLNATYSADGLTVYFSSNRGGSHALYVASRSSLAEPFTPARLIDELDMVGADETDPWISPDGKTLFFVRQNRLWQATRTRQ